MKNKKIELSMNMLIYYDDFFKKLKNLKDGESENMAVISFYKDYNNQFNINVNIEPEFETLLNRFKEDIRLCMKGFIDIIDFSNYKDAFIDNKEFELCDFSIVPKNEVFEVNFGVQEIAINYIFEDEFKPIARDISVLLEKIENTCANIFNNYILNEDN